jgi:hypothetical protein
MRGNQRAYGHRASAAQPDRTQVRCISLDGDQESPGPDPSATQDQGGQPDTAPQTTPGRFRLGSRQARGAGTAGGSAHRVGVALASRTAGWMVAAALAGSLVTLLLEPARSASTSNAAVQFRNSGRIAPAPARSAVAGPGQHSAAVPAQPGQAYLVPAQPGQAYLVPAQPGQAYLVPAQPGQAYLVPAPGPIHQQMQPAAGSVWFTGPPGQAMMPGCMAQLPPGGLPPVFRRLGMHRQITVGPGLPPRSIRISGRPIMKALIGIPSPCSVRLGMVPPPIAQRLSAIPGRCGVRIQIGRLIAPKRVVFAKPGWLQIRSGRLRASWRVVLMGPGGRRAVAIPGCVTLMPRPSAGS